jgi:aspartate/methionine/tyrosine aminotransferase
VTTIVEKFAKLATDNAPGQEGRQNPAALADLMRGDRIAGRPVDFSHGDVDAFTPTPGSFDAYTAAVQSGGRQAYTEYRGKGEIREAVAARLAAFTGAPVAGAEEVIITPGSQGALFLAVAATVTAGDKVAIVQPDYFANRKLVEFLDAEIVPVQLDYLGGDAQAGLDLAGLEAAFKAGAKVLLFSNPNNPAGVIYSAAEIGAIADLAERFGATVIVDQLYARLVYDGRAYSHLRASSAIDPARVVTVMGPSKTESLSGYRLGVAFGPARLIERMERLQAIVSLRAAGYNQAVLATWFAEPAGWMEERIRLHRAIRDDLVAAFRAVAGVAIRPTEAGSYVFPRLPKLSVAPLDFVRLLRHQADVIVTPGSEFSPRTLDSIRLNFSQDHAATLAAVDRIAQMIERYRG